jgi:hypothetical protein
MQYNVLLYACIYAKSLFLWTFNNRSSFVHITIFPQSLSISDERWCSEKLNACSTTNWCFAFWRKRKWGCQYHGWTKDCILIKALSHDQLCSPKLALSKIPITAWFFTFSNFTILCPLEKINTATRPHYQTDILLFDFLDWNGEEVVTLCACHFFLRKRMKFFMFLTYTEMNIKY